MHTIHGCQAFPPLCQASEVISQSQLIQLIWEPAHVSWCSANTLLCNQLAPPTQSALIAVSWPADSFHFLNHYLTSYCLKQKIFTFNRCFDILCMYLFSVPIIVLFICGFFHTTAFLVSSKQQFISVRCWVNLNVAEDNYNWLPSCIEGSGLFLNPAAMVGSPKGNIFIRLLQRQWMSSMIMCWIMWTLKHSFHSTCLEVLLWTGPCANVKEQLDKWCGNLIKSPHHFCSTGVLL